MGFSLLADGATAPAFPHVACDDGFAWIEEEVRRACFSTRVAAPAKIVAQAIDPNPLLPGVDLILSVAALNRAQLPRIFKPKCPNCQVNHLQRAMKRARAAHDYVHPGAITSLRKAMVPDYLMCQVWIVNEDVPPENASEEQQEAFRKRMNFMPFWRGDADRTLAAQIAFALQYQSKKSMGRPLGRPSKAAMIYLNPSPLIVPNQEKAS